MVNPLFQIGGLASGLDTSNIIEQLMQLERQPVRRFQQSQADLRSVDNAWNRVVNKLSAFRSSLDEVREYGALSDLTSASSSDEDAVSVTDADGDGEVGSLAFTVERLASKHRVGHDGSYGSATSAVGAGTFTLLDETGGEIGTITTDGSTTLQGLADQIDGLDVGVDASVLKVAEGQYQLVLTSTETGDASQFSTSTDIAGLGTATTLATGLDAHLKVGTLDVYRPTNSIDDLVPGAAIELLATTTADVTVAVERDTSGIVDKVQALVDAANGLLGQLASETRYDQESGVSGALQGDSLARSIAFEVRSAFTQTVGDGAINYGGQIGLSLARDGTFELDTAALEAAIEDDPSAVTSFLSATLGGDGGADLTYVGSDAVDADFTMTISQAAATASATGTTYTVPSGAPRDFTITAPNGEDVAVTLDDGMNATDAVARINAALEAAGVEDLTVELVDDGAGGDALQFTTTGYGSASTFSIAGLGDGLDGSYAGDDVIVDFGSGAVTGAGRSVTGDGDAAGLTFRVTGGVGSYAQSFTTGLGGSLDRLLSQFEGTDGRIQSQRDSIDGRIRDYDDQIAAFEQRLVLREATLRAQFTSLESTMGRLKSQGQWLTGALAGLPKPQSG